MKRKKPKLASPKVRKFARQLGANIIEIHGSQRSGRVSEEDVKNFIKKQFSNVENKENKEIPKNDYNHNEFGEIEIKDLPRIKKISSKQLVRSWTEIPHVTQHDEIDITEMEAFRSSLRDLYTGEKIEPMTKFQPGQWVMCKTSIRLGHYIRYHFSKAWSTVIRECGQNLGINDESKFEKIRPWGLRKKHRQNVILPMLITISKEGKNLKTNLPSWWKVFSPESTYGNDWARIRFTRLKERKTFYGVLQKRSGHNDARIGRKEGMYASLINRMRGKNIRGNGMILVDVGFEALVNDKKKFDEKENRSKNKKEAKRKKGEELKKLRRKEKKGKLTSKQKKKLAQLENKKKVVRGLKDMKFKVFASGDSYNDIQMLQEADLGVFFQAPKHIREEFKEIGGVESHEDLKNLLIENSSFVGRT